MTSEEAYQLGPLVLLQKTHNSQNEEKQNLSIPAEVRAYVPDETL
jgi:hypothetical protein